MCMKAYYCFGEGTKAHGRFTVWHTVYPLLDVDLEAIFDHECNTCRSVTMGHLL